MVDQQLGQGQVPTVAANGQKIEIAIIVKVANVKTLDLIGET